MKCLLVALFLLLPSLGSANAASRFLVACTATCTWDGSTTSIWSTTSGGGGGASVPGSSDTVTLDANTCTGGLTCTITVNTTVNVTSITMGACTGTTTGCILDFSVNNNAVTVQTFSGTGTGTRNLKMGNGVWAVTGTGTVWQMSTTTNLTFNANSSNITFTAVSSTTRTMQTGGLTYSTITISANSSLGLFSFAAAASMTALAISSPNYVSFNAGSTYTITNALSINGTSLSSLVELFSSSLTTQATISSANNGTFTYTAFNGLAFTGGGIFMASNSISLTNNTGITITAPQTGGGGIIGGWLLKRDLHHDNDNTPMFLDAVA